jgi:CRISPR-associated protein Cas1
MLTAPDFKHKQIIFVFLSREEIISFKNDNIIIRDKNNKIKHQSSCYSLFAVFLVGHITITSGLLERSKRFGFNIVLMNHNLKTYGIWTSGAEGNVNLRKKQYSYEGFEMAQKLVSNKINQQVNALRKIRSRSDVKNRAINKLQMQENYLMTKNFELNELLGIEGLAAKTYFQALFEDFNWQARRPRVKQDAINCLMDIGYSLLFCFIEGLLLIYGFDVYLGVYHRKFFQRKSLVCDLVEPFRPIIDYAIYKAFKLNQIKEEDFTVIQNQYFLFGKNAAPYVNLFLEKIVKNKGEIFLYIQSYYRCVMRDAKIVNFPVFEDFKT